MDERHPLPTPKGLATNTGPLAAAAWVVSLGILPAEQRWFVDIALVPENSNDTTLQIEIYAEEWGVRFHHASKASWIRITDEPFVHGADDHQLLKTIPPLKRIGELIRELETRHAIRFVRGAPTIRTSLANVDDIIRAWVATL